MRLDGEGRSHIENESGNSVSNAIKLRADTPNLRVDVYLK